MDERDGIAVETARVPAADGDDIVVVPGGPDEPGIPRARRLVIGIAIAAVLAVAVALAIVARGSSSSSPTVNASPETTLASSPVVERKAAPPRVKPTIPAIAPTTVANVVTPPTKATVGPPPSASPTTAAAASIPTPTPTTAAAPKQYGPSVLTWNAPSSLTIAFGKTAPLTVTAHNPTNGTVTLGHPLACTPRLDGSEICTETVQLIGPGKSASAYYVIDANGFAKGHYTLRIEGVLTVAVTVS